MPWIFASSPSVLVNSSLLPMSVGGRQKNGSVSFQLITPVLFLWLTANMLRNQLASVRGYMKVTDTFPIQKCSIFSKFKEISSIAWRQAVLYAAQAIPPIDAEIAEKGHLWTEISYLIQMAENLLCTANFFRKKNPGRQVLLEFFSRGV